MFQKVFMKMIESAFRAGKGRIPEDIVRDVGSELGEFAPELRIGLADRAKGALGRTGEALKGLFEK
ncbi:MAG: hypothetical protein C4532_00940 [Candidatus Abyssobacteria bacterium SURF_17]|uniref:Uncharacterized protein n=1 Tax=Candidatus Abyssobacteria bacterium SURF_17 TaxID=2093361 RepID=A0A419F961_9BACT|nr:MAG: hypothetical protein C4532_00940 [Candidatus Abyssubacteria bacterium SURF_17]